MTPEEAQLLHEWLAGHPVTASPENLDVREWELQSAINTMLLMHENRLSLSETFQHRLNQRIATLQTQNDAGTQPAASSQIHSSFVSGPSDDDRRVDPTHTKYHSRRRSRILVSTVAVAAVAFSGWLWSNHYPEPDASGHFRVAGGGRVVREATLTTDENEAQLILGGYCNVTLRPNSNIRIEGSDRAERIVLNEGSVSCHVDRGEGTFHVSTDLGEVSVLGTSFEVQVTEKGEADMRSGHMLVTVLTGTVLVATAAGQTCTLEAGESGSFGKDTQQQSSGQYRLVWADEFNRNGPPDPKNWVFENGFVRNHEAQWYQKENAVCQDGHLIITGREDIRRNPGYVKGSTDWTETKFIEYTSSSLMTKGLHQWTMGRFVARAKIPHGEGMWPAFWMGGAKGEWPSSGEIDIMEYYQGQILANVAHGTDRRWNARWHSTKTRTRELGGEKWLNEFHIWRMDWDTESIRLYVDDRLLNETRLAETNNAHTKWGPKNPFHHPHYMILNLALGGDHGGDMEKATLPAKYIIDYVRVYQRDKDRTFAAKDDYVPPAPYTGSRVGIHHFSELPKTVNKKCSWESGADSHCYAWKPEGSSRESAEMIADYDDRLEGEVSYRFVLNHGWSRWVLEMDPKYGEGVADFSGFRKMEFGLKSKDARDWESFRVIIASANGKSYKATMQSLGFKPDGKWHRCSIDLADVRKSGVDLTKIRTMFSIGWEGGVSSGESFKLDDLYLE